MGRLVSSGRFVDWGALYTDFGVKDQPLRRRRSLSLRKLLEFVRLPPALEPGPPRRTPRAAPRAPADRELCPPLVRGQGLYRSRPGRAAAIPWQRDASHRI